MPRLVNSLSGVVINVSDAAASALGPVWSESGKAEAPKADAADKPVRRARKSS